MPKPILRTTLCDLLDIEYPVMLAGMGSRGRATPPQLVAAVSNAGGIGVMGCSGLEPEEMRRALRETRALTDKPFGADLLLPASLAEAGEGFQDAKARIAREFPKHVAFVKSLTHEFGLPQVQAEDRAINTPAIIKKQVEVVLEERPAVFAAALGDPAWVVPLAREAGIKVIGMVGNVRNAVRQVRAGVDIIVAQGTEAGGHTGRIANFPLIPQVVDEVKPMPVVAAGGIADGRGVAAALALGAVGVWVGTAFLVSRECQIPEEYKEQILRSPSDDFVVTRSYTGKTARDVKNPVIEAWERSGLQPLQMPLQGVLMADFVEAARQAGRLDLINNPAGQIGGMLRERKPARQIMEEMVQGAVDTLQGLQGCMKASRR